MAGSMYHLVWVWLSVHNTNCSAKKRFKLDDCPRMGIDFQLWHPHNKVLHETNSTHAHTELVAGNCAKLLASSLRPLSSYLFLLMCRRFIPINDPLQRHLSGLEVWTEALNCATLLASSLRPLSSYLFLTHASSLHSHQWSSSAPHLGSGSFDWGTWNQPT